MALMTKGGIYVPPSVENSGVELRQRFTCLICGATFHDGEAAAYGQHVAKCARDNHEELRQTSKRVKAPGIFGPEAFDPEYEAYVRKTGKIR